MPSINESILAMTVTEGSQKAFRILAQRPELAAILLKKLKLKKSSVRCVRCGETPCAGGA